MGQESFLLAVIMGAVLAVGSVIYSWQKDKKSGQVQQYKNKSSDIKETRCRLCNCSTNDINVMLCGHGVHRRCLHRYILKCTQTKRNVWEGSNNLKCFADGCTGKIPGHLISDLVKETRCRLCNCSTNDINVMLCGHGVHRRCLHRYILKCTQTKRNVWEGSNNLKCFADGCTEKIPEHLISDLVKCYSCNSSTGVTYVLSTCMHHIHRDCLYKKILTKCTQTKSYVMEGSNNLQCFADRCTEKIPEHLISDLLNSRCWVCKKEIDATEVKLPCGHGMHESCLEADYLYQKIKEVGKDFTCLTCGKTTPFSEVKTLFKVTKLES